MRKCRNLQYMSYPVQNSKRVIRLSDRKEKALSDEEYIDYLCRLRIKDENNIIKWANKKRRPIVHFLLHRILILQDRLSGLIICKKNTLIPEKALNKAVIYVITHCGKSDIAVFNEVVDKDFAILSGDYESLHNNIEGLFTMLNGVVFFDMNSPSDRKEVVPKVVEMLKKGKNILCSMEAAWNISPNLLVTPLFKGMLVAAIEAKTVIIPVGIERFSKKLYGINVSDEAFDPAERVVNDNIKGALEDLRQRLAELKFELYYHPKIYPKISISREELGEFDTYREMFEEDILSDWTFTKEIINSKKYH